MREILAISSNQVKDVRHWTRIPTSSKVPSIKDPSTKEPSAKDTSTKDPSTKDTSNKEPSTKEPTAEESYTEESDAVEFASEAKEELQLIIEDLLHKLKTEDIEVNCESVITLEDEAVYISETGFALDQSCKKEAYERSQLRISMKVFLNTLSDKDGLEEAVDSALNFLETVDIDTLYLAVPANAIHTIGLHAESINQNHLDSVNKLWKQIEELIDSGKVLQAGLSDFHPTVLEDVYRNSKHKPSIAQVNLDLYSNTKLLEYLTMFAKENSIHLMVDTDPEELLPENDLARLVTSYLGVDSYKFSSTWIARILVHVKEREILTDERYLVKLIR